MKKLFFALSVAGALFMTSCSNDDSPGGDEPTVVAGVLANGNELKGNMTADLTLKASTVYKLKGALIVPKGRTLTIPAGTKIKADPGNPNEGGAGATGTYIAVLRGGKIKAEGTEAAPIVMSTASGKAGSWGGLVICGEAPINNGGANGTATAEVANLVYGGKKADDNSGVYKYMTLRGTGAAINANSEFNGVTFYGVGTGTKVEGISVIDGSDDGVEFFGGTVNSSKIYVKNAGDDSIDWTEGFVGTINYAYIEQGAANDRAIEADGNKNNNDAKPYSNPTIKNLTMIGTANVKTKEAVMLRRGTKGQFHNVYMKGYKVGYHIKDKKTVDNVNDGSLKVHSVKFVDVAKKLKVKGGNLNDGVTFFTEAEVTPVDASKWKWANATL